MKVIVNEKLVKRQATIGKWASLIGMGALLAGLVVSWRWPNQTTASFGCLIVGFVLASVGSYNMNRWVKEPRADQVLTKALKGFDNKHLLYHYRLPAAHVLLAPSGLFVFTLKAHHGEIRCEGEKWYHKFNWGRLLLFFGQESLGNPTREVRGEIERLRRFLDSKLPEADVPIEGLIVFSNPRAQLELIDPAVPVMNNNKLKNHLRQVMKKNRISAEQREELAAIFEKA